MAAILAHWEVPAVWTDPKVSKKAFIRWTHTAKAFGITDIGFVEVDELPGFGDAEVNITRFANLEEAISFYSDLTPVYIEQGGENIEKYTFPSNPLFIFGSDFGELPKADVSINTNIPINAEIACGIVLNTWRSR